VISDLARHLVTYCVLNLILNRNLYMLFICSLRVFMLLFFVNVYLVAILLLLMLYLMLSQSVVKVSDELVLSVHCLVMKIC